MPVRFPALSAAVLAGCGLLCAPPARAEQKDDACVTVVYPVADLVVRLCTPAPGELGKSEKSSVAPPTGQELMDLVGNCHPESWSDVGGRGTMSYFAMGKALVVKQPPRIQKDVAALLNRLRTLQVCLEVKLLAVPESYLERLGADFKLQTGLSDGTIKVSFLQKEDVLRLAQEFQADRRVSLMAMPRITLLNGQAGDLKIADQVHVLTRFEKVAHGDKVVLLPVNVPEEVGVFMKARPLVSADGRFVRVEFEFEKCDLVRAPAAVQVPEECPAAARLNGLPPTRNTQRIHTVLTIPDGDTAVYCGLQDTSQPELPVLGGKVPYVSRLFRNAPRAGEARKLLVLVTPHILEGEEPVAPPPAFEERVALPPPCANPVAMPVVQAHLECAAPPPATTPRAMPNRIKTTGCHAGLVKELLQAYDEAAAAGHAAEAARLARAALLLDPFCFQKK